MSGDKKNNVFAFSCVLRRVVRRSANNTDAYTHSTSTTLTWKILSSRAHYTERGHKVRTSISGLGRSASVDPYDLVPRPSNSTNKVASLTA